MIGNAFGTLGYCEAGRGMGSGWMRGHNIAPLMCALALSVTPVIASPTQIWDCKMYSGERWALALSSIWGVELRKGTQTARWAEYKIEGRDDGLVRATGPNGPKGESVSKPDLLLFNPRSGELTVTTIGSSERRKGKCDLVPFPRPIIPTQP